MEIENFFGFLALITSFIGLIPQIYKTYVTKSAKDISYLMLYNFLLCSISWTIYGYTTSSIFVLSSNIVGTITTIISILQKKYYDSQKLF